MERSLQSHNSADSTTVMNALQHSRSYPDRLLAKQGYPPRTYCSSGSMPNPVVDRAAQLLLALEVEQMYCSTFDLLCAAECYVESPR
jgi:hypothetical protein